MEERRATLLKGQLVHADLASDEGTVGPRAYRPPKAGEGM